MPGAFKKLLIAVALVGLFLVGMATFTAVLAFIGGASLNDAVRGLARMGWTYLGDFAAGTILLWVLLLAGLFTKRP
jgi:hypothetical protein